MVLSMSRISRTDLTEACAGVREQSSSDKFLFCWVQGFHGQGKVREKQKFFKVREKSGNFAKSQGKS